MAKKYTYSRQIVTPDGVETFQADQFDSFDEAKKSVDKAIYERRLEIRPQGLMSGAARPSTPVTKPSTPTPATIPTTSGDNGGNATGNVQNPPAGNQVLNQ